MKKQLLSKVLPWLLALIMVLSLAPTLASADGSVDVDIIVAQYVNDDWEILYPNDDDTALSVSYTGANATLYDAMLAVDATATTDSSWGFGKFFNLEAQMSGDMPMWYCEVDEAPTFNPDETIATGEKILFYYMGYSATAPTWDDLSDQIASGSNPGSGGTITVDAIVVIENYDGWQVISPSSGTATTVSVTYAGADPVALDLAYALDSSFDGTLQSNRPKVFFGYERAQNGYGNWSARRIPSGSTSSSAMNNFNTSVIAQDDDIIIYLPLNPSSLSIPTWPDVEPLLTNPNQTRTPEQRLADLLAEQLTFDKIKGANTVATDIQADLASLPSNLDNYAFSVAWSSSDTSYLSNAGKLTTRPAFGSAAASVTLTVMASKNGYSESKNFTVTVKAVTQAELDAANAELDAIAAALTFDVIKNANSAADAVTSSLQMVYRGLGYPGTITWATASTGESGIEIEWESSDAGTVASHGTVYRPSAADKNVTLTATLSAHRLAAHLQTRTVEIPLVVRKISHSADIANISLSPSMGMVFDAASKTYTLTAPAIADSVTVNVTSVESGTLISSGSDSARGSLTFSVPLTAGPDTIIINTEALDTPANTDSYTIIINKAAAAGNDAAIADLLLALASYYTGTSNDWAALDMAAYGLGSDVSGTTIIENSRDTYATGGKTDLARAILTLTSLGVDATNVYGGSESLYLDFVAKLGASAPTQTTELIFTLLALDSANYDDSALAFSRETVIDALLTATITPSAGQSAWAISGSNADIDVTAMAIAALAPYYLDGSLYSAQYTQIKTVVDGALAYLANQQNNSGHYNNANATAMVIIALSALGEDADANNGSFAKAGNSLISGLLSFRTTDDKLGYTGNTTANALSTEQGFRALVAYRGYLYANSSAYNVYQFAAPTGDGTELTGEVDPGTLPPDPGTPKTLTVRVEDLYSGATLLPQTTVTVAGSHLDAVKAALFAHGYNPATDLSESAGMVTAILGVGEGTSTGWMYAINGEIPVTLLTQTQVANGDEVVLFFIDWNDPVYFTTFDKATATVEEGQALTLSLTGLDPWSAMGGGGTYEPLSGATVYAYDGAGNPVSGVEASTDASGKVTLTFPTAGSYTISAQRAGATNTTDLVPPLCTVTVTTSGSSGGSDDITVYFSLQGINESSEKTEIWINKTTVTGVNKNATVADVIIKALAGTGYSQVGAQSGYIKSVTTPGGFTLREKYGSYPDSGWLFKVNSKLPSEGIDSYTIKDGDHVLLYFTFDYNKDPDAGKLSGSGSSTEESETATPDDTELDQNPFSDIKTTDWFYEAVLYVYQNGLFTGTSESKFSPDALMTRGMLVTVLGRLEEIDVADYAASSFDDVKASLYYSPYITWAAQKGIVTGYNAGLFGPDDNITREQLALILYRYAGSPTVEDTELDFADADKISPWALKAMRWAVSEGIITGRPDGSLDPAGFATRAEVAAMIQRFAK